MYMYEYSLRRGVFRGQPLHGIRLGQGGGRGGKEAARGERAFDSVNGAWRGEGRDSGGGRGSRRGQRRDKMVAGGARPPAPRSRRHHCRLPPLSLSPPPPTRADRATTFNFLLELYLSADIVLLCCVRLPTSIHLQIDERNTLSGIRISINALGKDINK